LKNEEDCVAHVLQRMRIILKGRKLIYPIKYQFVFYLTIPSTF